MRKNPAGYLRAFSAVCISITLALVVGSFMGAPVNPTDFRQMQAKVDAAIQSGIVFRDGEAEAYLSAPSQPAPPFWAAVLDWHAWLLAPGLILAFLILRPAAIASLVASCAAAAFLYYFVAPKPALILIVSAAVGMLGSYALGKLRPNSPQGAA